ncbi:nucleotidyltransferase domain-containing protein [bacterium]|nr:nucleotidyltransferase domain-containing protein [bacterium]
MNNFGLPEKTRKDLIEYFCTKTDIEKVLIYGSRAKGTYHNGSDIDFAIWTENHSDFNSIAYELDELPTPYKFDTIDYKTLSSDGIKKSIDTDGILFYQRT